MIPNDFLNPWILMGMGALVVNWVSLDIKRKIYYGSLGIIFIFAIAAFSSHAVVWIQWTFSIFLFVALLLTCVSIYYLFKDRSIGLVEQIIGLFIAAITFNLTFVWGYFLLGGSTDFASLVYYSISIFFSNGFASNLEGVSKLLSSIEAVVGYIYLGVFISMLFKWLESRGGD